MGGGVGSWVEKKDHGWRGRIMGGRVGSWVEG